jgi:DNA-directed RNA polymerase specialized sigma24 family protein
MRNRDVNLVDRIVAGVCRRGGVGGGSVEQLASEVRRELTRGDSAVWRAHDGQSSLTAYLTVVVERLLAREAHPARAIASSGDAMWNVLPDLTLEERMLLRFRFGAGLSIADSARLLGIPKQTAERRLDELLRRLREVGKNDLARHTDGVEIRT